MSHWLEPNLSSHLLWIAKMSGWHQKALATFRCLSVVFSSKLFWALQCSWVLEDTVDICRAWHHKHSSKNKGQKNSVPVVFHGHIRTVMVYPFLSLSCSMSASFTWLKVKVQKHSRQCSINISNILQNSKNFAYLRTALKSILSEMLQVPIDRAVLAIHKGDRLSLVQVNGSHFEHGL